MGKKIIKYNMFLSNYSRRGFNFKFAVKNFFDCNRVLVITLCAVVGLGVLTGIFVAVKSGLTLESLNNTNLCVLDCSGKIEFAGVWDRFCSILVNLALISVATLYVLLLPLGYVVLVYRAYLLGFNLALLFCLFGLSGALTSILVILPCQFLILALEMIYFIVLICGRDRKKRFGSANLSFFKILILFLMLLLAVCTVEAILLSVFSAKTILVI